MQTSDADILTKKKREWAAKRKPEILRGTKLAYNASLQDRYFRNLNALVLQMAAECEKKVFWLFEAQKDSPVFATDDSISSQAKILTNQLTKTFQQLFERRAQGLAEAMVNQADKTSSANLHESLKTLSGGLSLKTTVLTGPLKEVMKASITDNVKLITSISQDYLTQMTGAVMRSITTGNGLQDLVPFFERYKGVTIRRARLIANNQTKQAYASLNLHRMKALDIQEFEWLHSSGGNEPRILHEHLSGKIFRIDDPPIIQYAKGSQPEVRGFPGQLINCRCTLRPVISFGQNTEE